MKLHIGIIKDFAKGASVPTEKGMWQVQVLAQMYLDSLERIKELENPTRKITGGRVPFGYICPDGVNLVEVPEQQKIIEFMRKMRKANWSYREIARRVKSEYGVKLSHTGVMRIVNRNPEPKTKHVF
jgi:hypothetical protein